ncbi:hypothetical protein BH23CHL10_BH23CHL10_01600 [soil metagenome]
MQSLQTRSVQRLLIQGRETSLRRAARLPRRGPGRRHVRHWIGVQLVCFGSRLANEPTMRPARAR